MEIGEKIFFSFGDVSVEATITAISSAITGQQDLPTKIKVLMLQAGISAAEIGRRIGTTRQAVSGVINFCWGSPRVRKAIADALGVAEEELWGNAKRKAA